MKGSRLAVSSYWRRLQSKQVFEIILHFSPHSHAERIDDVLVHIQVVKEQTSFPHTNVPFECASRSSSDSHNTPFRLAVDYCAIVNQFADLKLEHSLSLSTKTAFTSNECRAREHMRSFRDSHLRAQRMHNFIFFRFCFAFCVNSFHCAL